MRFDATPVIDSLKNVLTIFCDLQFNYHQSPIMSQRQQIDWPRAASSEATAVRSPKLRVQRRDDQAWIQSRNVAPQNRFQPRFARSPIKPMPAIATISVAISFKIEKELSPVALVKIVQQPSLRSFDTKPDSILLHHATRARERQSMETQSVAVTRCDDVDCLRSASDNFVRSAARFGVIHRWKASQPLSPNVFSFKSRDRCDSRPFIVDFQELNSVTQ